MDEKKLLQGILEARERAKNLLITHPNPQVPNRPNRVASFPPPGITPDRQDAVCIVCLGRNGDIIHQLPIAKWIAEHYGKPHFLTSPEFLSLLEGVSYVIPEVANFKQADILPALDLARRKFSIVLNGQAAGEGLCLKYEKCFNYDLWKHLGFENRFYSSVPLVFDKRNLEREAAVISSLHLTDKPVMLVSGSGVSSPFNLGHLLYPRLVERYPQFEIVDLSKVRAGRIYDLLGLFEKATMLVTTDTMHLHLAGATSLPVVGLFPNGWGASEPRCNLVGSIKHTALAKSFDYLYDQIDAGLQPSAPNMFQGVATEMLIPKVGKLVHVYEQHEQPQATIDRNKTAVASWATLYDKGMVAKPYPCSGRSADKTLGDKRALPYLRDLLEFGMDGLDDSDVLVFTNDDIILHPDLYEYLRFHCGVYGLATGNRLSCDKAPNLSKSVYQLAHEFKWDGGRDLYAFPVWWLRANFDTIPDFILGCTQWDVCMTALVRLFYGIKTTVPNNTEQLFPAEIPLGYVPHITHKPFNSDVHYLLTSPAEHWNARQFRLWEGRYLPTLRFRDNDTF